MTTSRLLKQAKEAISRGRKKQARGPLLKILEQEPRNEMAWLYLCSTSSTPQERRLCLQRVLQINPKNETAREALENLEGQEGKDSAPLELKPSPAKTFPCPQCGAKTTYLPAERSLHCSYCGQLSPIEPDDKVKERTFHGTLFSDQAHVWGVDLRFIRCSSCGGQLAVPPQERSHKCPFCASPQVLEQAPERPLVKLDSIVLFQFDMEEARKRLRDWLGTGWFRPSDAQRAASLVELYGVYLPFWTFDGSATARWRVKRPLAEVQQSMLATNLDESANGPSRRDMRSGETWELFDDVVISESHRIPENMINEIYPFDMNQLVPYSSECLAGWPAEVSQLSLAEASIQGRAHMSQLTRQKAHQESSDMGSEAMVSSSEANLISYKHVLLPVWLGTYQYKGQPYRVIINGQTGKVWGQAPVSGTRILLISFFLTVVIGLLVLALWLGWP